MAFDLQEQEQIADFKAWWNSWGKFLATAVILALLGYLAWQGWHAYQKSQAEKAGLIYARIEGAIGGDAAKIRADADLLKQDFSGSAYASRGALFAAKASADAGQLKEAEAQLNWVVANSDEADLRDAARLRLAAVQLDQKQPDAALKTLGGAESTGFAGLVAELRGDILLDKGDSAGAREAYKEALSKLPKDAPNIQFVQVKLDALQKV
ncbi:membrane protein [Chitiniphilus shinanonensis]|uniref:Ancillary SecYEG translocon subunit n=1 Tax=Chitiniphilus shinanonensis TaxID=553088 RepID=A0ABQ6BW75_9NEIS|nr:tetratricopeptide repeat protein [Chitiniphilus shinanonensis]GLS04751.1 membrane protein [Chitiniphilus shinanonensis]